jgi:hypothetical protein
MKFFIASIAALVVASPLAAQSDTMSNSMSADAPKMTTTTTTSKHKMVRHRTPVRHHRKVVSHKHVTHIKASVKTSTTSH